MSNYFDSWVGEYNDLQRYLNNWTSVVEVLLYFADTSCKRWSCPTKNNDSFSALTTRPVCGLGSIKLNSMNLVWYHVFQQVNLG